VAHGQRALEHASRAGATQEYCEFKARHFLSIIYLYSGDLARMLEEFEATGLRRERETVQKYLTQVV
jgi:hypothetical protein